MIREKRQVELVAKVMGAKRGMFVAHNTIEERDYVTSLVAWGELLPEIIRAKLAVACLKIINPLVAVDATKIDPTLKGISPNKRSSVAELIAETAKAVTRKPTEHQMNVMLESVLTAPHGAAIKVPPIKAKAPVETASELLDKSKQLLLDRAAAYDEPSGERSMGKTIIAFNAITGNILTESEGWLLQQLLKDVRQWASGPYHKDSAEDCITYSALKAESLEREKLETLKEASEKFKENNNGIRK